MDKPFKQLHVGSLGGLHYELYHPDPNALHIHSLEEYPPETALLHANALFWGLHFNKKRVLALAEQLRDCVYGISPHPPAYPAIAADPQLFAEEVEEAIEYLCDQGIGERRFFRYVETLSLLCQLYSDLEYGPHTLTLYEGFLAFELSSIRLIHECLHPQKNPYLNFIKIHCIPVLEKEQPSLIWLNGRITIASMAIARLAKKICPNAHISVVGHSSEYYSLNKITNYLIDNKPLFEVIDSIVLDDTQESRRQLVKTLSSGKSLQNVSNLMLSHRLHDDTSSIMQTPFRHHSVTLTEETATRVVSGRSDWAIAPEKIANIKLFPQRACHWAKCSFCGINQKYAQRMTGETEKVWDVEAVVDHVAALVHTGIEYVWCTDEAVPVQELKNFAKRLIERNIEIIWQVRARFDPAFLEDGICKLLARSGLREIRFGLESVSPRILKLMEKFPGTITRQVIEKIISKFNAAEVSVHCPMIIAFPSETAYDRDITYAFLKHLRKQYENFSFNINIFGLDVSSRVYKNWEKYDITHLDFPCATKYFLGNIVEWNCQHAPFVRSTLDRERNQIMRELLYPWIPETALTLPHVYYRLSETIRNTLTFKAKKDNLIFSEDVHLDDFAQHRQTVVVGPNLDRGDGLVTLYNWNSHRLMLATPARLKAGITLTDGATTP